MNTQDVVKGPNGERCGSCRFWVNLAPGQHIYGQCHRLPPRAQFNVYGKGAGYDRVEVSVITSPIPEWPNTGLEDWCGEFAPSPTSGDCNGR